MATAPWSGPLLLPCSPQAHAEAQAQQPRSLAEKKHTPGLRAESLLKHLLSTLDSRKQRVFFCELTGHPNKLRRWK